MKELLDHLNKIYVEQLSNCSEICRKIVFALFAVTWGLCYSGKGFSITSYFLLVFLFLTLYLIIDALQFYLTAISYRKHFHKILEISGKGEPEEIIKRLELDKRKRINDRAFRLMNAKLLMLPLSFIALIIGIIDKLVIAMAGKA